MSMFLSCLLVNVGADPDRPRPGRLWLNNIYRVHQRLSMAFPSDARRSEDPDFLDPFDPADFGQRDVARGSDAGFLFRVDTPAGGNPVILVQSVVEPDWDYAFANAMHLLAAPPQVKAFEPVFAPGQSLQFRLRANPTVKRDGKRLGLFDEASQEQWLARKAETGGFRVLSCRIMREGMRNAYKGRGEQAAKVTHFAVRFDGILEVTEADRFLESVKAGIGSAKAFGFGLLSLAPAR